MHLVVFREIPFQNIQLIKQPSAYSWLSCISSNKHNNLLDFIYRVAGKFDGH